MESARARVFQIRRKSVSYGSADPNRDYNLRQERGGRWGKPLWPQMTQKQPEITRWPRKKLNGVACNNYDTPQKGYTVATLVAIGWIHVRKGDKEIFGDGVSCLGPVRTFWVVGQFLIAMGCGVLARFLSADRPRPDFYIVLIFASKCKHGFSSLNFLKLNKWAARS